MDDRDSYPEYHSDDDGDDVEILEVVGVEESAAVPRVPADPPPPEPEGPSYVLDFDRPEELLAVGGIVEPGLPGEQEDERQRWVRLRADYDNLRKRIEREREDFERHANLGLVSRLLPTLDNLERALAAEALAENSRSLREGLVMIHRQLTEQLRREGLQPIEAVGRRFDPQLHDAVATESRGDAPAHTVVEELRRGYLFHDRVLRPTLVKVSTGPAEPAGDS